jgi:flagellin-like protein
MNFTDIKRFLSDEDAVSPVIGVILMVAITVILAAVIGTFVLGLGDQVQSSAPNANFQFGYDGFAGGGTMDVTHNGGQDIDSANLEIQVGSDSFSSFDEWSGTISTGDTETVNAGTDVTTPSGGDTVRVVWTSSSGGSSNTIGQSTVPN